MQQEQVILFDGVCNLCNGSINRLIRADKKAVFKLAPMQSEPGRRLLSELGLPPDFNGSFVLIDSGKVYMRSTAVLKVLGKLPWYWKILQIGYLIPRPLRDSLYNWIAKNRYRWFGKKEACMVPTPELRSRFLP